MLLVNARAGASDIHGLGLIAREHIPAGAPVWEFRPGFDLVIGPDEFARLAGPAGEQVRHYGFLHEPTGAFILSADDDRFTNHADAPNTRLDGFRTFAIRDIRLGEEITGDYRELARMPLPHGSVR